jgi:gliding motility-associated-like protein
MNRALLSLFVVIFCLFNALPGHGQTKEWIWMKGDNATDLAGVYGTMGVPSAANKPGSRYGSVSWTDASGDLWLFGGEGYDAAGLYADFLSDLWKYSVASNQWTWIKGDNTVHEYGVYGTKGAASSSNKPGSRYQGVTWTDAAGKLWLFGGVGYSSAGAAGLLNDLWKYDPSTNQWTWISGDNAVAQKATYGTKGISNATNKPGSRVEAVSWIDAAGTMWMFGGNGYDASTIGYLNDLWKYDPSSNQWTWMSGDNTINKFGIYGTQTVAAAANKPGSRILSVSWTDATGNLWLFGGTGNAAATNGELDDMWKYNPASGQWTWMKGNTVTGLDGIYGTQGVGAAANVPRSRYGAVSWKDKPGNFWMFGGGSTTASGSGYLNDLWEYDPGANEWTWVKGINLYNIVGTYGTQGVAASANNPGSRWDATSWTDGAGNLWLFGGEGYDGSGNSDKLNDLWKYDIACTAAVAISASTNNICPGTSVTFTAAAILPGITPIYQWQKNGINVGTNINTYTDATLNNGDFIKCIMTSSEPCVSAPIVSSGNITMIVGAAVTPTVSITASATSICSGTSVTFTATGTNGGPTPTYQWQKNGINVGTNSSTYTDAALNNNDAIKCIMTSSISCISLATATSITIVITIKTPPTVSISASAISICSGTSVTFTATPLNGTGTPSYQWKLNGANVGTNSSTYSSATLANGNTITCVYSDNSLCIPAGGVTSSGITMAVSSSVTPTISVSATATGICIGTSVTFTATTNVTSPSYQWKKNGINVGSNSDTYTDNALGNSDNISCTLTASGPCYTATTAVSAPIIITLFANPVVSIDHTPVLCSGTNLDAGSFSSYLWNNGSTNRTISITTAGTYSVQVTDNNGCKGSDMTTVTDILPVPSSFLASQATLSCETLVLTLSSSQIFSSYLWSTGETSPTINVLDDGSYWLEATNSFNCKAREYITVKPSNCPVIIPNTFTPNNDLKNDLWIIKGLERRPNCRLEVFNRYGQIVFKTIGYNTPWNGTFNGKSLPFGTYYYILDLNDGSSRFIKGYVTVIK